MFARIMLLHVMSSTQFGNEGRNGEAVAGKPSICIFASQDEKAGLDVMMNEKNNLGANLLCSLLINYFTYMWLYLQVS